MAFGFNCPEVRPGRWYFVTVVQVILLCVRPRSRHLEQGETWQEPRLEEPPAQALASIPRWPASHRGRPRDVVCISERSPWLQDGRGWAGSSAEGFWP